MTINETINQARKIVNKIPECKPKTGQCQTCGKDNSPWSLVRKDFICSECLKQEFVKLKNPTFIINPNLLNKTELEELMNAKPGKIIKTNKKALKELRYES